MVKASTEHVTSWLLLRFHVFVHTRLTSVIRCCIRWHRILPSWDLLLRLLMEERDGRKEVSEKEIYSYMWGKSRKESRIRVRDESQLSLQLSVPSKYYYCSPLTMRFDAITTTGPWIQVLVCFALQDLSSLLFSLAKRSRVEKSYPTSTNSLDVCLNPSTDWSELLLAKLTIPLLMMDLFPHPVPFVWGRRGEEEECKSQNKYGSCAVVGWIFRDLEVWNAVCWT